MAAEGGGAGGAGRRLPPHSPSGLVLETVEMHTGGEPLRVIPRLEAAEEMAAGGLSLLSLRREVAATQDHVRRALVHEPRGHDGMYGAVVVRGGAAAAGAHLAALFLHGAGYSAMCGHAVLALGRFALDYGLVPAPSCPETAVRLRCPCGPLTAFVPWDGRRSGNPVRFHSVPAFAAATDLAIDVPGHGKVVVDIGYGGTFYAFLSAEQLGLDVCSSKTRDLVNVASAVTEAVKKQFKLHHPESEDLAFLYGTILTDGKDAFSEEPTTNICVFADEQVDRSPTGSGVTARIALQYHKGLIQLNQTRTFRSSTTGSLFTGKAVKEAKFGDYNAVVVEVSGEAFYTGTATFTVEEEDPLKHGFFFK
ncbi:LOW QUALITY PROTEIN: trans-3-hydroxy-L-proline dehydratase [Tyto alba]|uniref:LOW QUALITY PROTEIN: trans-3-hydroxy-L-proline dehydratase n=1 Tax=Tyto alba TaxID=56313 RepID=UPI001C663DAA|nr:LOW QUALITY PROTEIN: trans-3-hydroxy-L-proline dehydratase [Tyto alba]